jgi:hypothetical protein
MLAGALKCAILLQYVIINYATTPNRYTRLLAVAYYGQFSVDDSNRLVITLVLERFYTELRGSAFKIELSTENEEPTAVLLLAIFSTCIRRTIGIYHT